MNDVLATLKSFHRDIQLEEMSEAGQKRAQLNARLQEKLSQQNALFLSPKEREWQTYLDSLTTNNHNTKVHARDGKFILTLTEPPIYYALNKEM